MGGKKLFPHMTFFISLRRENLSNVWLWVQIDSNKYWQLKQININAMQNDAKC
jgi:hypothetical protein